MKPDAHLKGDRLAVLIDADNASHKLIEPLLKEITKYGTANVKRIYGDWTTPNLAGWKSHLHQFAILPIQQFSNTTGKNATDSALIIDAMDLLYTQNFDGFCIVSSDSDFTRLASRIRESGLWVYGFGERKTPEAFRQACDRFIFTDNLVHPEAEAMQTLMTDGATTTHKSSVKAPTISLNSGNPQEEIELMHLLEDAYEATTDEDGWANLGSFGDQLIKLSSSFDPRNYDYKKLGELIQATDLFEVKSIPSDKNPLVKALYIKLKSEL